MNRHLLPLVSIFLLTAVQAGAAEPSQAQLKAEAKISEADAEKTALAKVPNATVTSAELEREHGHLIWSFDLSQANTRNVTEVQVDAKTGAIVSTKTETPKDEANEAKAEKKEQQHK
jgi:uncharacterized membrane protein YkoI